MRFEKSVKAVLRKLKRSCTPNPVMYTPTQIGLIYHTAMKITNSVFPVYINTHIKFNINLSDGSQIFDKNLTDGLTDGQMDGGMDNMTGRRLNKWMLIILYIHHSCFVGVK